MELMEMPVQAVKELDFADLYERAFPGVAAFVRKMKGTFQDAQDIFHDALVIYHEKSRDSYFTINVSEEAYIAGIAKHLWLRKFSKAKQNVSLDAMESGITIPDDYFPAVNTSRLLRFLEITGKKCLELLTAFYYEKLSAREILNRFDYKTEHSATVQKYKCIQKAREALKQKSMVYEDFLE